MNQVILKMKLFIMNTTLKQCDNLTSELLEDRLCIDENETEELIKYLIEERVLERKYTIECPKCNQLNTLIENAIDKSCKCQFCTSFFDGCELKNGASIRYILDINSFNELMEENYKTEYDLAKKGMDHCSKVIKLKLLDTKEDKILDTKKIESRLFISHSSKDLGYVEAFVEFLNDIGMDKENMFCSSVEGYDIQWGENIYDYLSNEFNDKKKNLVVLFMLSKNYYESPACLNEMGAAWVLKKDYRSILLPGFEFKDMTGAINPYNIAIKLEDDKLRNKLNDIKIQFQNFFGLKKIDEHDWDRIRDKFIKKINNNQKK